MRHRSSVSVRRGAQSCWLLGGAGALVLALTACGSMTAPATPSVTPSHPSATPEISVAPSAAPTGADAALASFAEVTARVWASDSRAQGRAYIDALEQAGFAKDSMQVTADRSTVGNAAESLQFSVAWDDTQCLVGQVGPSTGEPVTAVLPRLADGACLVGGTQPIDW
ncbi:DUF6993 domain-containing protein [Microbacterium sp. NPDC089987]|uniref:DUF6993 domain-containing protein n=1 Tax=Microbacterium sp. NPDC089987 TaxID=3364202 RepID=UPI003816E707